ncbi:uncharacterized protein LOC141659791 [Apium graveolens]|uniref:uncharacterized protein LOC141659791 n=1 Tax=Apium graveolens TaxID=4045 RepID=UPI003D7A91BB
MFLLDERNVMPKLKQEPEENLESNLWYLDNGASNHMTRVRSKFAEFDESVTGEVRFGDGSTVTIKGKGSVVLRCQTGEEHVLSEVYFIPSLCNNIISLGQLAEEGCKVVLHGDLLWVNGKDGRLLVKVKHSRNRLYKMIIEGSKPACLMSKAEEDSLLWHCRLGHVNLQAMNLMSDKEMARGLPKFVQPNEI